MKKYTVSFLMVTGIAQTEVEAENEMQARQLAAKQNEEGTLQYKEEELYIISLEENNQEEDKNEQSGN